MNRNIPPFSLDRNYPSDLFQLHVCVGERKDGDDILSYKAKLTQRAE